MAEIATAEKDVSIGITFKEAALAMSDSDFKSLMDATVAEFQKRVADARGSFKATKDGIVLGEPTLEEKGVQISVGWTF